MKSVVNPDMNGVQTSDPILSEGAKAVPALHALTPPMPNTKLQQKAYFVCTLKTAAMHRADGKKLPFINGVLSTSILEDIAYLRKEIELGNQYVREADTEEVEEIEALLDPRAAAKKSVRAEVEAELRAEIEAKVRAELTAELVAGKTDAAKIAGVDMGQRNLPNNTGDVVSVPLTPVSSTDIAAGAAGMGKNQAAVAAAQAALAQARANSAAKK